MKKEWFLKVDNELEEIEKPFSTQKRKSAGMVLK